MAPTSTGTDYFLNFFLSWKEVISITNSSESSIRRAIKAGTFPQPVPLFKKGGRVGFLRTDFLQWVEGKRNF